MTISERVIQQMIDQLLAQKIELVYRSKTSSSAIGVGQIVVVVRFAGEDKPRYFSDQLVERFMQVDVMCVTRSESPDAALDATREAVISALMADRTLGGLVTSISEGGTQMSYDDGQPPIGEMVINFEVRYSASFGSLNTRMQ